MADLRANQAEMLIDDAVLGAGRSRARTVGGAVALRVRRVVASTWLLAVLLLGWQLYATWRPSVFFPPLDEVMTRFREDWLSGPATRLFLSEQFFDAAVPSLGRLARGWGLAVVVGIACGVLMGRSRFIARAYSPTMRFWMAVPNAALLPIAVQIFGVRDSMNVFLIFVGAVGLIIVNTADGVAGVDEAWIRSAHSMQVPTSKLYLQVIIPAAMPAIMTGLRVSIGIGLILMIISELYATTSGLGYQVTLYQQQFRYIGMWSTFVLIAVIGLLLNGALGIVERRVLRWQRRSGLGAF
ncbi:MAG TPA: ABC transporter permease [Iamia sp.]|nr:ABC transporter permease [Iamia sp.]